MGTSWITIWEVSGSQGKSWQHSAVPLTLTGGQITLRIEYLAWPSNTAQDPAIDDF